ncbi:aspartate/glutamate racemase family protein [Flavobacterium sp. 7A]|uniref:aspartate/glutamate racemase family protein n=1 Tax=Flavobacterium sp. 7A TaxID=2940571 RepID=UPI002225CDA1|nr:aspartate/glutamate racemase family protein [Flavobacterium sp. 7A]MCW2118080.1 aspartate racemase [Flavobacterium sp. 7A]
MSKVTVGLLGLGSRSTLYYIKELNRWYNQKKGRYSTFPFVMLNADFDAINPLLPNTSEALDAVVQTYIDELEKLAIITILIPNITLHETIDRLRIQKKILHPLTLAVGKIKEQEWSTIVLFGSLHSMESNYIRSYFNAKGIEVQLPSPEDRLFIDKVRKQTYAETETPDLIASYHSILKKYTENFPVLLACTELSILKPTDNNRIIDMAQLQIEQAVSQTA